MAKRQVDLGKFGFFKPTENDPGEGSSQRRKISVEKYETSKRKRSFLPKWEEDFPGIKYDGERGIAYCQTCRDHPAKADVASSFYVGSTSMRIDSIRAHWSSPKHELCMMAANEVEEGPLDVVIRHLQVEQREILIKLFNTAYFVLAQELPFTSFPNLLSLQTKNGSSLQGLNSYKSDQALRRFVPAISEDIREPIIENINTANVLSIMFDGATDASVSEVEIVYCRIFNRQLGQPVNHYIKLVDLEHAHADGTFDAINNAMISVGIHDWLDRAVGAGSDGASVNIGRNNSVATRIQANHPYILAVHCVAHRLELGVLHAIKDNNNLATVKDMLHKLFKHYHYAPKALRELREVAALMDQEAKFIKPTRLSGTRWVPHLSKALEALIKSYSALQAHFEHVQNDQAAGNAEVKGRAKFLTTKLKDYRILKFMHFMLDMLDIIKRLSLEFQRDNITAAGVIDAVDTANMELVQLQIHPGTNLQSFIDNVVDGKFKNVTMTYFDQDQLHNTDMYNPIIENVREHVNARVDCTGEQPPPLAQEPRPAQRAILSAARIFEVSEWPLDRAELAQFGIDKLNLLLDHFQVVLTRNGCQAAEARREWLALKIHIANIHFEPGRARQGNIIATLFQNEHTVARFSNVLQVVEITQVIPMSSAICERGFSAVKRIKSDWRATLQTEMLDKLLLVSMSGPSFEEYDARRALQRWWEGGQRARRPDFVNLQDNDLINALLN